MSTKASVLGFVRTERENIINRELGADRISVYLTESISNSAPYLCLHYVKRTLSLLKGIRTTAN